jgi:hypothetical protein
VSLAWKKARENSEILHSTERQAGQLSAVMGNPEALARVFAQALVIRHGGRERDRTVEVESYRDAAV